MAGSAPSDGSAQAAQQVRDLWKRYASKRDPSLRDQLILMYMPLVGYVASTLHRRLPEHVDKEDLHSDGLIGLIEAVDRFQPDEGVKFETFALPRIRGNMLDGMRQLDWVPRSLRSLQRKIDAATAKQMQANQQVDWDKVADEVGVSRGELDTALANIGRSSVFALDGFVSAEDDEEGSMYDRLRDPNAPDPLAEAEREERYAALVRAIDVLPERERMVLVLFYYEEQPLKEIAALLGVTESRVSQLQGQALTRLNARLKSYQPAATS